MELNEFQVEASWVGKRFNLNDQETLTVYGLGISEEAGEVTGHIKKWIRDDEYFLTPERKRKMVDELGDVLWYVASISREIGVELNEVAELNLKKLRNRREEEGDEESRREK